MCQCEFHPMFDDEDGPSCVYLRTCEFCWHQWGGLHCPHDGYQNLCPACDRRPTTLPEC